MSESILVIEDDASILLGLRLNLQGAGYEVRGAQDGAKALALFAEKRPDLVILDLMLPVVDGLEVLRRIRSEDETLPVIILTALGSERDKVAGLDLGANDYVTKPFSLAELLARVRAALRIAPHDPDAAESRDVLRAGAIELDRSRRRVLLNDHEVALGPREFDLLLFFMERPERVVTREQILASVWRDGYEGTERTVDNFVSSLRRKLGDDKERSRHLQTVWGVGYRFVP